MRVFFILICTLAWLQAKSYTVGFAQDTLDNDWRKAQVDTFVAAAGQYPFLNVTVKDAKGSVAAQIFHIDEFVRQGVDFIVTSPKNAEITGQALQKALDKGIRVILLSRGIKGDAYTTFIRPDNTKIARQAASYMLQNINNNATVLMLQGVKGATTTQQRTRGFMDVITSQSDISVIKKRGNFLRSDAIKIMEQLYEQGVQIDAIYSQSDSMLVGVRKVMKRRNKAPVFTVGIDYIQAAKEAILSSSQDASFTYPTAAKEGVEAIVDMIKGKDVPKEIIIDTQMVTKQNAAAVDPIF